MNTLSAPLRRMKEERLRLRYSDRALSAAVGLSPNAHSQYESGMREPGFTYLIKLADIGMDVCYILFGSHANANGESHES